MRLSLLAIAVFCVCWLSADVMYEKTVTTATTSELVQGTEIHHRVFIKGDAARVERSILHPEHGEITQVMIYRFDRGVVWNLDMDNRQYAETVLTDTVRDIETAPGPQPLMDDPEITVTETGNTKTIVGKTCEEVIISMAELSDSMKIEVTVTMWVTQELDSCEELIAFNQKRGEVDDLLSCPFPAGASREQTTAALLPIEMNAVKGFPLQVSDQMTMTFGDMSMCMKTESVFTKLDDKPISQLVFEIPYGFTLRE